MNLLHQHKQRNMMSQDMVVIGQLPRVSVEDPERKRVDSVFKNFVCLSVLCLSVSKFSHFLYYKVL